MAGDGINGVKLINVVWKEDARPTNVARKKSEKPINVARKKGVTPENADMGTA